MSSDDRYLWDHVITHIIESGSPSEATATASDPRWVVERLLRSGLAGPASDLAVVGSARGAALRTTLLRAGHLLRPSDSPNTLVNTFVGRLYDDTRLRNVAAAFESLRTGPLIKPRWPLPDQLQRTLLQILTDHTGPVKAVTMSLDGKIVATAQGNRLRIFSTLTGVLQTTFGGHKSAITSALMLPQATSLVTTQRGLITIWDIASGGIKAQVRCRNNPGTLAVSAGRGRLFWAVGRNVYSWSGDTTADCTKVARLGGTISALAVSNDGSWLAAGMDGVVLTLRASTGKVTRRFSSHTGGISAIAVSNDERLLAAADEFSTKLWNLDTGTLVHSFVGVTPALSTVFSPDGSWIATGGTDGLVRVWSIKSGMLAARLTGHASRVGSITVSQSGDLIASASDDRTVRIWDARPSSSPLPTQNETFRTFAYMKGEERLFAGGADGHIWVCTPPAADMRRAPLPQFGNIQAIALSPDDRQMAVAYFRGYIHQLSMIDLRSNSVGRTVFIGAAASSVSFGSRSRHLAVVGEDRLARIIDVEHGRTMLIPHKNINSAVFSPEGNILVLGSADSRIRVWDVSTWAVRLNLVGHRGCVRAMQFGPDGSWLVGGGEDGVTYVWSVGAGAVLARMAGHDGPVKSLSMSIDGRWIATSGADNTVRIWDTRTFTAVTAMRLNSSPDRLQFSSDGQFLAGIGAAGIYMLSFLPGLA